MTDSWKPDDEEAKVKVLIQAALSGPTRPMRGDQIDALVRLAVTRRQSAFPGWALVLFGLGILAVMILAYLSMGHENVLMTLAIAIPMINLALSPAAALLIIKRTAAKRNFSDEGH